MAGAGDRHVRDLHRFGDLGRRRAPGAGAPGRPSRLGHRCAAGRARHGLDGISIADPADQGMLDVVGFDTATPELISDFARGAL